MSYLDRKTRDQLHLCRYNWCHNYSFYEGDFCNKCQTLNRKIEDVCTSLHPCLNQWCLNYSNYKHDYCNQCQSLLNKIKYLT